jgi:hypothetical protein
MPGRRELFGGGNVVNEVKIEFKTNQPLVGVGVRPGADLLTGVLR